ncbi:MAG: hypothetical protein H0W64_10055 [Gammaproteobacteria bacterium]|nr:hypothetical protein [Gammaproteobacteria bacterium]
MALRFIKTISVLLSLMSASTIVFASPKTIPCPPLTSIQQAAQSMDLALRQDDGTYYVGRRYHQRSFENEHALWHVSVDSILAKSEVEAITLGKEILKNVSFKKNETATEGHANKLYLCQYGRGNISALGFSISN